MGRGGRLLSASLLAGLGLVSLLGAGWFENDPWKFSVESQMVDGTPLFGGRASSLQGDGGFIGFGCVKGVPRSDFVAFVSTSYGPSFSDLEKQREDIEVTWRVDTGPKRTEVWKIFERNKSSGVWLSGEGAYTFALTIMRGIDQVVVNTPNGILVNDLSRASRAIRRLLSYCDLPKSPETR